MTNLEEPALAPACRTCSKCGESKSLDLFLMDTPKQRHNVCRACRNDQRRVRRKKNGIPPRTPSERYRDNEARKKRRRDPARRAFHICQDSRINDRKRGRENDLGVEFVEKLISKGCSYCGVSRENAYYMTLDRVDNQVGHLRINVVPSCLSCNLTRGTMPYEAWLLAAKGLREARSRGLLDGWVADYHLKGRKKA